MTTTCKLPLTAAVSAKKLAAYLKTHKVPVRGKVSEPNEYEDGEIDINSEFHVQVGQGYAMLCKVSGTAERGNLAVKTFGERHDGLQLLRDIQKALKLSR